MNCLQIVFYFFLVGEEMEGGSVVPKVVGLGGFIGGGIGLEPCYFFGCFAQSLLCSAEGFFGYVQHGDVLIALREQMIHQETIAAAYVYDAS